MATIQNDFEALHTANSAEKIVFLPIERDAQTVHEFLSSQKMELIRRLNGATQIEDGAFNHHSPAKYLRYKYEGVQLQAWQ